MTLKQQINELESYNFLNSAWRSEREDTDNLNKIGFVVYHQPIIFRKSPDFILIRKSYNYALIVECKSGHFQDDDMKRANEYINLPLREVENECRKILRDGHFSLNKFDVAFQYYKNIVDESDTKKQKDFNKLKSISHIFACDKDKGLYYLHTNRDLSDADTNSLFKKGIKIPKNPNWEITISNDADDNLLAWAIIDYGLKRISIEKESIKFTKDDIYDNIITHHTKIDRKRVDEILTILEKLDVLYKDKESSESEEMPTQKYYFTKKSLTEKGMEIENELYKDKDIRDLLSPKDKRLKIL